MLLIRSVVYDILMYSLMLVMGILCAPLAIWSKEGAYWSMRKYATYAIWLLEKICGLKVEVRGEIPDGTFIVCSKHQSFLDILVLATQLPRFKFIMKSELKWAPVLGLYAMRIGTIPVKRGRKGGAVKTMVTDVEKQSVEEGQTVIYPQGTRVLPGVKMPYKVGAAVLYDRLGQTCYPVATNIGVFWARRSPVRKPGVAVLEFMDPIPPGLPIKEFLPLLEETIETRSDELMAEAGFDFSSVKSS